MNDLDRDLAKRFARPVMRNAFRAELRNKLMREAQTILSPRPARSPLLWLRPALAAGAVTFAVITVAGTVAASSLAGDPLFGVKRATEEVAFTFTFDDVARVQLLSDLTDRRLAELSEATRERPAAAPTASAEYAAAVERFARAVETLKAAPSEEKRDAADDVADAAKSKHDAVLETIDERLPDDARPNVERAKDEERRIAPTGRPDRTQRPGTELRPTATPRTNETSRPAITPRPIDSDRPETPRPPTSTPRR